MANRCKLFNAHAAWRKGGRTATRSVFIINHSRENARWRAFVDDGSVRVPKPQNARGRTLERRIEALTGCRRTAPFNCAEPYPPCELELSGFQCLGACCISTQKPGYLRRLIHRLSDLQLFYGQFNTRWQTGNSVYNIEKPLFDCNRKSTSASVDENVFISRFYIAIATSCCLEFYTDGSVANRVLTAGDISCFSILVRPIGFESRLRPIFEIHRMTD